MRRESHFPVRPVLAARSLIAALLLVLLPAQPRTAAQEPTPTPSPANVDGPPFSLPLAGPAGPATWLYEQHYGNSTSAYNYGDQWYAAGQGMHFGVDLETMCGTPVLAIADGVVRYVDAEGFGAGPHSLVIDHPGTGYTSLYGHLQQAPDLKRGDVVQRGQQIGLSGDPDLTCESRPHLHLEIRNPDYTYAYNPIPLIDAHWHMLTSLDPDDFQQDLDHPYRWMKLEEQPDIKFGANYLNRYARPWPVKLEIRPPGSGPAPLHLEPLAEGTAVTLAPVSLDAWNLRAWWRPGDNANVYVIDAIPGQETGVFRQPLDGSPRQYLEAAPPTLYSADGSVTVRKLPSGYFEITRLGDGQRWEVPTNGNWPTVSPDGTRLLWEVVYGELVPGNRQPGVEIWVSNLDGAVQRRVATLSGGYSMWLDAHRLLMVKRINYTAQFQVYILDIDDPALTPWLLGEYRWLRGLQIAPGGQMIAYFLPFQENPADSTIYVQRTEPGSTPHKLDFFGAYHWRDDQSLYTLSYDSSTDVHTLGYLNVADGTRFTLTDPAQTPIRVANGDWSVSPDGTQITFVDPQDYGLYVLKIGGG